MAVISALPLGQLQTFSHLLAELRRDGVTTVSGAVAAVEEEMTRRHDALAEGAGSVVERKQPVDQKMVCECGAKMEYCAFTNAYHCRCGFSRLREVS